MTDNVLTNSIQYHKVGHSVIYLVFLIIPRENNTECKHDDLTPEVTFIL